MKNRYYKTILILLAIAGISSASLAQDKATLDLLVSKGIITRSEADDVAKRATAVTVTAKEKAVKKLTFSGRIQEQFQWLDTDAATGANPKSTMGFQMRRLYLGVKADLGAGWSGTLTVDFAKTGTNGADYLAEAFITKQLDTSFLNGDLDFGYKKVQFGFEENTSSSKLLTVERSLATRFFVEPLKAGGSRNLGFGSRYTGAFWQGKHNVLNGGLEYGVAVTNSLNYSMKPGYASAAGTADNNVNVWANLSYSKKFEDVNLKVGVNGGWGPSANIIATENYGEIFGANPYAELKWKELTLWADFLIANVEKGKYGATGDATPMGLNLCAEYLFDLDNLGKVGPSIRYSYLDTDGRGTQIGDGMSGAPNAGLFDGAQSVFVGANWYIMGNNVKFQAGYEWAQYSGKVANQAYRGITDSNALRMQMQVLF